MEFIGHFFLAAFIALLVFATFTFGFMLLAWFVAFAVAISVLIMLRGWFRRCWFLYVSRDRTPGRRPRKPAVRRQQQPQTPPKIIDADWQDITDKK